MLDFHDIAYSLEELGCFECSSFQAMQAYMSADVIANILSYIIMWSHTLKTRRSVAGFLLLEVR